MLKQELRAIYKAKRKQLDDSQIADYSNKIFENIKQNFSINANQKVHIFLGIEKLREVKTQNFIQWLFSQSVRVYVPKIIGEQLWSIEIFPDSQFVKNDFGINEPADMLNENNLAFDYIITPALYCDHKGNRVGYGKGFYDRLFDSLTSKALKIGVNYFTPLETIDDVYSGDIPLDYLVTPEEILSFEERESLSK